MWAIWALSLLGPLLLSFKNGERFFVAVIGFYGVIFWVIFGWETDDSKFYTSAILFALLGIYNAYHSHKLKERKKQCHTAQSPCEGLSMSNSTLMPGTTSLFVRRPGSRLWVPIHSTRVNPKDSSTFY